MDKFKEEDLFLPIKDFFNKKGYKVNAEVKNCDIVIHNNEELIIIELKKTFCTKLLYQAIERKKITDEVYICVPKLKNKNIKYIKYILKSINVGLIFIDIKKNINKVDIVLNPKNNKKIKKTKYSTNLLKEIEKIKVNINKGGTKTKINTAYREKCIHIACIIKKHGAITAKELIKKYGFEKNIGNLLRNNYYNWYEKEKRGVYFITEKCKKDLKEDNFKEIVNFYKKNLLINKKSAN